MDDKNFIRSLGRYLRKKFDLTSDQAQQAEVVDNISRGVEFGGTNLWVLIFATMVASLGLNVNSAAVIIGAMLISPLMGPIMGLGLSLGINDYELFKRSLRNFGLMITVSILTSTLYFAISPLSDAQSELLARTQPTIYDVLIAFFGGLAGIVAQSRKDRTTTVIPGVAIATALMPPLCTAGYGIATGQFTYFLGAAYLFFINTVFIAAATFAVVHFLRYDKKELIDKQREKKVHRYMIVIMVVTLVPSVFMAYRIIQQSVFENNAKRFVHTVFHFEDTQVIDYKNTFYQKGGESRIELLLIGEPISLEIIENARAQLVDYGLRNTTLIVRQSGSGNNEQIDVSSLNLNYSELLDEKNRTIRELRSQLAAAPRSDTLAMHAISREAAVVVDNVARITLARSVEYDEKGVPGDSVLVCTVTPKGRGAVDKKKLAEWLQTRTGAKNVKIFVE